MRKIFLFSILAIVMCAFCFAPMASAQEKRIRILDKSWDSSQINSRIAGFILEHGYGYDVTYQFAEVAPGHLALERGDVDIVMEIWADNVQDWLQQARESGKVITVGDTFKNATQGWFVPTYVIEGDPERGIEPMAPELESVEDLPKYKHVFQSPTNPDKGRLYSGPTGWDAFTIDQHKLKAYDLKDDYESFAPGSETALVTVLLRSYDRGEPVLAYFWEPHGLIGMLDMTQIKEPTYDEELWNEENDYACAYPSATVLIGMNSEYAKKHPDVKAFLENYETTVKQNNKFMAHMVQNETDHEAAAIWFLKNYEDVWENFIPGKDPEIIEKVKAALPK
jgi:glycine betaine/proline transport system substrate-binding protein